MSANNTSVPMIDTTCIYNMCLWLFQVSDFGLANRIDFNPAQVGGKFPIKWTAPESLRDNVSTHSKHRL